MKANRALSVKVFGHYFSMHFLIISIYLRLQLLRMFFRQQDELRRLKDELAQKDVKIRQLELELNNLRNINNRNNNNNSSDSSM